MIKFIQNLFKSDCYEEITNRGSEVFKMLHQWSPCKNISANEARAIFQRVFNTSDGQKVLMILTNIVWAGKGQKKMEVSDMSWYDGREALILEIFSMLKLSVPNTIEYTK